MLSAQTYLGFFRAYCNFFETDARWSLLKECGRDLDILFQFQNCSHLIVLGANEDLIRPLIADIRLSVNAYKNKCITPKRINCDCFHSKLDELGKFLRSTDIREFHEAYSFYCKYPLKKKGLVPVDTLLVEFNNSLSHILSAIRNMANRPEIFISNKDRAAAHLHRASLDAYKEAIKLKSADILANKGFLKEYLTIREEEMALIGHKEVEAHLQKNKQYIRSQYAKFALKLYTVNTNSTPKLT